MKYLLDTCVISDFVKGDKNTLIKIKALSPSDIVISTITFMEIQYGLALNPAYAEKLKRIMTDFLASIEIILFNQAHATQAALIRALLKKQGNLIGSYDILLAGVAVSEKMIFITSNINEFHRINGLIIENWRV
jgi:tRNA(fMet)-specific endonuclease VapC